MIGKSLVEIGQSFRNTSEMPAEMLQSFHRTLRNTGKSLRDFGQFFRVDWDRFKKYRQNSSRASVGPWKERGFLGWSLEEVRLERLGLS